ncbi:hypothetical protein HZA26_01520 [Candidatus Nomurabacteria bacterium]|nr:hypothetical protein [Candidatus Nomurabacteria bacterium]
MEPNFQTSFIPKKPVVEEKYTASRPIGFFTVISIFIFFTILLASGGLYFWKGLQEKNISSLEQNLIKAEDEFKSAGISRFQILEKRINASSEVFSKHIAVSPIFKILQDITMKTVQYTNFGYTIDDKDGRVSVKMKGVATGYRSIALQADLFSENEYLIDPIFSNPSLDPKGNVIFDLDFFVDSSLINYKEMLKNEGVPATELEDPSIIPQVPPGEDTEPVDEPVVSGEDEKLNEPVQ